MAKSAQKITATPPYTRPYLGPKGRWVEIQIRSKRMDAIAERGLAAHWRYKAQKGEDSITPQDDAFENWLNAVKETLGEQRFNGNGSGQ